VRRRRRGENLNFPTVYAQGLLIFHFPSFYQWNMQIQALSENSY